MSGQKACSIKGQIAATSGLLGLVVFVQLFHSAAVVWEQAQAMHKWTGEAVFQ